MTHGTEFDWHDANEVIVREQPAIAVYINPAGDIVLRQRGDCFDDDAWIWFHPEHAAAVAAAILEAAALDAPVSTPEPTQVDSKPKDSTGAGRQRRYRERKKKESTSELFDREDRDVTRDTVTGKGGAAS